MSDVMWFSTGGQRVQDALSSALAWCESCCIVSDGPRSVDRDDAFWAEVSRRADQVRALVVSGQETVDAEVLQALLQGGRVRRFNDGNGLRGHFAWFEREHEVRVVVAGAALRASTVTGPALWFSWQGLRSALPAGLSAMLDDFLASSVPFQAGDLVSTGSDIGAAPAYARPIQSVREVLGIRSAVSFFDMDPEAQELALWSALVGEGPVDLEQAIRLAAERLRAQGFLDYQLLRHDGRVYAAIEERLLAARRSTARFDRPRNGFVRAIQANVDELTAEQWRDCVIGAFEEGARVDREQAVRLGFTHAQEVYGASVQRLRGGGRADQALRSAINSAIRQGYLERDGAAYLVRVAASAAPALRGVLRREGPAAGATEPEATAAADAFASQPPGSELLPTPSQLPALQRQLPEPQTLELLASESHTQERAIELSVKPETANADVPLDPLDERLDALDLPTRAANWSLRRELDTVRDLIAWHPEVFAKERNVGRRTVRETRERLEAHLGCTWEEAHVAVRGGETVPRSTDGGSYDESVDSATEALTAGGPTGWVRVAASLTAEQREIPVAELRLPTRVRNFVNAEGIASLGELLRAPYASLLGRDNLGRKSLNDTLDAVRDQLSERSSPPVYGTFVEAWQAQLAALEPIPRMIVTRRAGMHGARETLEDLGAMLGITRERVRQIEARVIERLAERSRWRKNVEANLTAAFAGGRALPLSFLAQDPWWSGVEQQELLLDYVVRRIFEDELFLIQGASGKRYLAKLPQREVNEHIESAKNRVAKLEFPVEMSAVDAILRSECAALDPVLFGELEIAVRESLHAHPERPDIAVGYGRHHADAVLAFLTQQAEPVPVALLEEHCGRGVIPDEVLYFKRGVVGLKRHFPDFDGWMERLVPASLEVMSERPPGRQWLVPEIHDALRERGLVPDWLGHWHLASVLRLSGKVDYLGRLRVAAKDSGQEQRLLYEELLEQILREAGRPLGFEELLERARVQTDVSSSAAQMIRLAPFVRLDDELIGLLDRDVPGGPEAVAAAIEAVVQRLNETQEGLTPHHATELVNGLSFVHAAWTRKLVTSVLRNEPTLRIDRTKNIGLDEWDDVRCPARAEFIRREVQKAGGRLALDDLGERLASFFGRAPDRSGFGVLVREAGLVIEGNVVSRPLSIVPEASPSRADLNVPGIPTELREMFEELVRAPLSAVAELRGEIEEHLAALEQEYRVNEFVDVEAGRVLAGQCHALLDRWHSLAEPDRQVAHAALRYFVSWHDLEHDLDIGGLDDDKQIMKAVLLHLGLDESADGAAPS